MPTLSPVLSRATHALTATRPRRAALALAALAAFGGTLAASATFALVGTPPTTGTQTALDLTALAAIGGVYLLAARSVRWAGRVDAPLRALWEPLLLIVGVVGVEALLGTLAGGALRPGGTLPADVRTASLGAVAGLLEAPAAVLIALSLRPLALYRRRRAAVGLWKAALGLSLALPVAMTYASPNHPFWVTAAAGVAHGVFLLLLVALALRQGWVGALTFRQRLGAAGLSLLLAAAAAAALVARFQGPASVRYDGPADPVVVIGSGPATVRVPYAMALSPPAAELFTLALVFAALFALTAALVLVFGLPASDAVTQRAGERRALQSLADLSGRMFDRAVLVETVARGPVEAGLADVAWLALADPSTGSLAPRVVAAEGLGVEAAQALADTAALVGDAAGLARPLVLPHASADHRVRTRPGAGLGSLAVVALPSQGGAAARGALFAGRTASDAFEADDLQTLGTFAAQATLALANADLFAEAVERERLARELALARDVQRRLLPQSLPEIGGVEIAAAEQAAKEVGGDYYDVVQLDAHCLGVLVADVSGKGAPAAFYMAELKGIFQSSSRLSRAPGEFLALANEALSPSLGRGVFVSAVYAVLDARAGTLAVARAGHCPAVLARDARRDDGGRWLLRGGGLAIGLARGPLFARTLREQTVRLAPGDTVVLYTDGLVEARDADGTEYGYERLADAVAARQPLPAPALRDALLADLRQWAGGGDLADDLTLVTLRWTGRADVPVPEPDACPPLSERPALPDPA